MGNLYIGDSCSKGVRAHRRQGHQYTQSYSRGKPLTPLQSVKLPMESSKKSGTQVRFLYDPDIFAKK